MRPQVSPPLPPPPSQESQVGKYLRVEELLDSFREQLEELMYDKDIRQVPVGHAKLPHGMCFSLGSA